MIRLFVTVLFACLPKRMHKLSRLFNRGWVNFYQSPPNRIHP
jgi:hypothetical protein